ARLADDAYPARPAGRGIGASRGPPFARVVQVGAPYWRACGGWHACGGPAAGRSRHRDDASTRAPRPAPRAPRPPPRAPRPASRASVHRAADAPVARTVAVAPEELVVDQMAPQRRAVGVERGQHRVHLPLVVAHARLEAGDDELEHDVPAGAPGGDGDEVSVPAERSQHGGAGPAGRPGARRRLDAAGGLLQHTDLHDQPTVHRGHQPAIHQTTDGDKDVTLRESGHRLNLVRGDRAERDGGENPQSDVLREQSDQRLGIHTGERNSKQARKSYRFPLVTRYADDLAVAHMLADTADSI